MTGVFRRPAHISQFRRPNAALFSVAAGSSAVAVNDANLTWSPYNWFPSGSTYKLSNTPGAYVAFSFSGTSLSMQVDGSILSGTVVVAYRIDGGAWQTANVSSGTTSLTLATGLASATHTAFIVFQSAAASGSRWTGPANALKVTGFTLSASSSASAYPTVYARSALAYGDSITEGLHADVGSAASAILGWGFLLREALRAEVGVVGFNGQGWTQAGDAVPMWTSGSAANTAWNLYYAGQSRLSGGLLTPTPTYIMALHGCNDALQGASNASVTAAVNGWLTDVAAAAPSVPIWILVPMGRYKKTALAASNATLVSNPWLADWDAELALGLVAAGSEAGDGTAGFGGASWASADGLHPLAVTHARFAARVAATVLGSGATGGATITSLSPASAAAGGSTFTLTVNGTSFVSGAVVSWNGTPLTTTFVNSTQLTASVSSTLIAASGSATVTVANP